MPLRSTVQGDKFEHQKEMRGSAADRFLKHPLVPPAPMSTHCETRTSIQLNAPRAYLLLQHYCIRWQSIHHEVWAPFDLIICGILTPPSNLVNGLMICDVLTY